MRTRVRQLAVKLETTEGTANAPAAADGKLLIYEAKLAPDIPFFERQPAESTFSPRAGLPGGKRGTISGRFELKGSGTATTEPFWFTLMKAMGMVSVDLESLPIGAVTGGPFVMGEIITGANAVTATVAWNAINGDAAIFCWGKSGALIAQLYTGGTSAATATASGTSTIVGKGLRPSTAAGEGNNTSVTADLYEDGIRKRMVGGRGNAIVKAALDEPGFVEFSLQGGISAPTDVALLTITHETTVPPMAENVGLSLGGYLPDFTQFQIDLGNTIALRRSMNAVGGIKSARITARRSGGELDPEMVLVASHDFFGRFFAGTQGALDAVLGTVAGNRIRLTAPKIQYSGLDDGDRDGMQTVPLKFQANRNVEAGDDEVLLWQY